MITDNSIKMCSRKNVIGKHQLTDKDRIKGNKKRWESHKIIYKKCLYCGKEFSVYPRDLRIGKGKYCSQKCSNIINGRAKAKEKHIKSSGYIYIKTWEHPNRDKQNLILEHRVIVEKAIGRYLNKKEVVHHIDENKQNNELYNLFLCKNDIEHRKIHKTAKMFLKMFNIARYQYWEDFKCFDITKNTQEQLQEMIQNRVFNIWGSLDSVSMSASIKDQRGSHMVCKNMDSMNELWLAFVMKEKYHKVWDGENWVEH